MAEHLKITACRLPQRLLDAAQRFSDLYHVSQSELLRQGLEYRLSQPVWPPDPGLSSAGQLPPHIRQLLAEQAARLRTLASELDWDPSEYNGSTPAEAEAIADVAQAGSAPVLMVYDGSTTPSDTPALDAAALRREQLRKNSQAYRARQAAKLS